MQNSANEMLALKCTNVLLGHEFFLQVKFVILQNILWMIFYSFLPKGYVWILVRDINIDVIKHSVNT